MGGYHPYSDEDSAEPIGDEPHTLKESPEGETTEKDEEDSE
jgi:hypothetical protein